MKKLLLSLLILLLFPTNSYAEKIDAFYTNIEISKNGSFNVTETISYDFENSDKHGIYRDIPRSTPVENFFRILEINPQSVTRDNKKEPYKQSSKGDYLSIKIGDADKTITGKHTYAISYNVQNGIGNYDDHDEIYWNSTGNEWNYPITKAVTTITPPSGIPITQTKCFTGIKGSKEQNCTISKDQTIFSTQELNPQEGLTIVAAFPPNTFPKSTLSDHAAGTLSDTEKLIFLILFVTFQIFLNIIIPILVYKKFTHKNNLGPARVNFDFPTDLQGQRLAPALAGATDTAELDKNDVIATIFDLAIRKHIKITQNTEKVNYLILTKDEQKYYFEKLEGEAQDELQPHEQILIKKIFSGSKQSVELSSLNTEFYKTFTSMEKSVYTQMVKKGIYTSDPKTRKTLFITAAIFSFFFGGLILAIVCYILSTKNTNRTTEGDKIDLQIDGLKLFLQKMERNYKWQADQLAVVEQMIPYAMAFGYIDKFMDSLKTAIPDYQPTWYSGTTPFYAMAPSLMSTMNSGLTTNAPSSSSGFSGGGSSGGGGGGGGGGSW
jgi:uncharacterized membrane protein